MNSSASYNMFEASPSGGTYIKVPNDMDPATFVNRNYIKPSDQPHSDLRRVVVDSRDRNTILYPKQNRYQLSFDNEIRNVTRIDLVSADVPLSAYLVSQKNELVPFSIDDGSGNNKQNRTAVLRVGDYDTEELREELERALDAAASDIKSDAFRVKFVKRLDRYEVYCENEFDLLWRGEDGTHSQGMQPTRRYAERSAGRLLGFDAKDASSVTASSDDAPTASHTQQVVAPFRKNFSYDRYIVLRLSPTEEAVQSANENVDKSFAVLVDKKADNAGFAFFNNESPAYVYNPPVARLRKLEFTFTDRDGEPYDFQNHDHRLELMFHIGSGSNR